MDNYSTLKFNQCQVSLEIKDINFHIKILKNKKGQIRIEGPVLSVMHQVCTLNIFNFK